MRWTDEEVARLYDLREVKLLSHAMCAELLGRSEGAVAGMLASKRFQAVVARGTATPLNRFRGRAPRHLEAIRNAHGFIELARRARAEWEAARDVCKCEESTRYQLGAENAAKCGCVACTAPRWRPDAF